MDAPQTPPTEPPFQLWELSKDQKIVWDWAWRSGYLQGHEDGWSAADAHANFLTRRAAKIVHSMADVPEVDADEAARIKVARDEQRRRLGWIA